MNKIKKLLASLTAFVMAVGLMIGGSVPVHADTITVTINPSETSQASKNLTYTYYAILKASRSGDQPNDPVSYYVENQILAEAISALTINSEKVFTVQRAGSENHWNVETVKDTQDQTKNKFSDEQIVNSLYSIITGINNDSTKTFDVYGIITGTAAKQNDGTYQFTLSDNAYVIITSNLGSRLIADTYKTSTVTEKNAYPSAEKKQSKTSDGSFDNTDLSRSIGDNVYYHIDIKIPASANQSIKVIDIISNGLTMNPTITWSVTGSTGSAPSSLSFSKDQTITVQTGETAYSATIPVGTIQGIAAGISSPQTEATLTASYSAEVNANATKTSAESNKAHIDYGNETYVTPDSEVKVYTYGLNLLKYDASENIQEGGTYSPIANATFQLLKGDSKTPVYLVSDSTGDSDTTVGYRVATSNTETNAVNSFTTVASKQIVFKGLDKDTVYYLRETTAPAGFNRVTDDIQVNVTSGTLANTTNVSRNYSVLDNNNDVISVANHKGSVLPSTGGIGTTIFYIAGGAIIIAAVVMLVSRRKRNA